MMTDFEIEPGVWFGEVLHAEIEADSKFEITGEMVERVQRVAARLQSDRRLDDRFTVEVPWISAFTAFTAPGRYIYFCRRLLERCPDDDTVAFVVAHEIAHHDLGHLSPFRSESAQAAAGFVPGKLAVLFFRHIQKRLNSPEWEVEADRRAAEHCVVAGYDGRKCLRLFDIMEEWAIDHGDLDGVFGLETEQDGNRDMTQSAERLKSMARVWLHQRVRGYLPIRERREIVRRAIEFTGDRRTAWWTRSG